MQRFHLHVFHGEPVHDHEGLDRPDLDAAIKEAVRGARDLIASDMRAGRPIYRSNHIDIADHAGRVLHTVRYADVLDVRP